MYTCNIRQLGKGRLGTGPLDHLIQSWLHWIENGGNVATDILVASMIFTPRIYMHATNALYITTTMATIPDKPMIIVKVPGVKK